MPNSRLFVPLAATLLTLGLAVSGCSGTEDADPADEAAELANALTAGGDAPEWQEVGFHATAVREAAADYARLVDGMGGLTPEVSVGETRAEGDSATAELTWSWPIGTGWSYSSEVELARAGDAWEVDWAPSVVHPELTGEAVLEMAREVPARAEIRGARGSTIVTERPVLRVGIDKAAAGARAVSSAKRLARMTGIEQASYVAQVRAAGEKAFVEAIVYRQGDQPTGIGAIPGARSISDRLPLAPSKTFGAEILGSAGETTAEIVKEAPERYQAGDVAGLSGLQERYDEQLRGTPGAVVSAVQPDGTESELATIDPVPGKPLKLTLVPRLQSRAEDLLGGVGPAALVALRPSDGAIVAAANAPANDGINLATYGKAAPGSTFKAVSSLALIRSGMKPQTAVQCPDQTAVDGKAFENYDDYPSSAVGSITLRQAVANSCNTAMVDSAGRLGEGDLSSAAASLGMGIDHEVGFPAFFGEVPRPESEVVKAADTIGQGTVTASPMAMATVIGSIAAGHTVVPHLVDGVTSPKPKSTAPLTGSETRQLREMLRSVVTEGSGAALADVPGPPVMAKTGTAEYERDGQLRTHAWMIAAQGDLAVAVYVEDGESGSGDAGPILEEFMRAAR